MACRLLSVLDMTTLETIDVPRLALVIGGQAAPQAPTKQPQQPAGGDQQGGQQPAASGGLGDIFAQFQQGLQLAGGFLGGLQQILASIQGFAQMFQQGQGGQQPAGGDQQPDTQAA